MENQLTPQPKKKKWIWLWIFTLILAGFFGLFFLKTSFTVSQIKDWQSDARVLPFSEPLPQKDPDRINILLLGIRGTGEENTGDLLTDTVVLVSIKKSAGQLALISVPRDLYIPAPGLGKKEKINFAYAYGGLDFAKKVISYTTNVYIDHALVSNFNAFQEVIEALGGVNVYLEYPFEETFQWAQEGREENRYWFKKEIGGEEKWVFHLPAGQNFLDGQTALYYVRSRFSTSDFDRMRRQQQVLMAVKDKALSLGVLANPFKIYELLDILGKNIKTDMNLKDIKNLINLVFESDTEHIRTKVFDTTPEGLLYQTFIDGQYVLLPIGDDYNKIQEAVKKIFD